MRQGFIEIAATDNFYGDIQDTEAQTWLQRSIAKYFADTSLLSNSSYPIQQYEDGWFRGNSFLDKELVVKTEFFIRTTATCTAKEISALKFDNGQATIFYEEDDGTERFIRDIVVGRISTTYLSHLTSDDITIETCHDQPRCGVLIVTQIKEYEDVRNGAGAWLYLCQSTVHRVSGTSTMLPPLEITDDMAITAATSLASSGLENRGSTGLWMYSYYREGFGWGVRKKGDAQQMAMMISRATAGVFAVMDHANPRKLVPGMQPWRGVQLKIRWPQVTVGMGTDVT
ncbi:hypothetical protein BDZ91DRAFT_794858 [Kalaharituber pfeilii]|nr:hypothetical protein BDZ91DRAFT_794858 [Kalaharituber pfeilii]